MKTDKTITVQLTKQFTTEEIKLYNELIEVLIINMFGEAQREGGLYVDVFNPNNAPSKIFMYAAERVVMLFKTNIYVNCSLFKFIKTKFKYRDIFGKSTHIYRTKKNCRPIYKWLSDISNARHLDYDIWFDVWEYLDEIQSTY